MIPSPETDPKQKPIHRIPRELAASSGFLLARLGFRFKAQAVARLEQEGVETSHYSVLALLDEGARLNQAAIAASLGLDPSRLVALLDSLEGDGMIERQRDPRDRRRQMVTITASGKRRLRQLRALFGRLEEELLAPLDRQSRETLHELLMRLAAHHDPSCAFRQGAATPPLEPVEGPPPAA